MRIVVLRFTIAALLTFVAGSIFAANDTLILSVDPSGVTVANVTKRGTVILFTCSRIPQPRSIAVQPQAYVLHDDDGDGVVRYAPTDKVPLRSAFVAVDESTGEYATGSPAGFPMMVGPIAADAFRKDAEDQVASLALAMPRLVFLLVRPGFGAWRMTSWDGGPRDRDGKADGRQQLNFADAKVLDGKDNAPSHLKAGDVIAVIATGHLDVFVSQIAK